MKNRFAIALLLLIILARSVMGRNVDLSTVPTRDTVQLTIYNSEDLTLVRETRKVTFRKGANPLQFSWANTLIDPTSVELKFLTDAEKLDVLDTTFPQDKPQMLYWNVQSDFDGEATIEISYFTSGITWSADYQCTASSDETHADLQGFVRITNNSGEEYESAQVRLVVGTINLVEKIAQLAQIPMDQAKGLSGQLRDKLRDRAMDSMVTTAEAMPMAAAPASSPTAKEIVKEGLSEYFIYTIDGTETIPNGWSKRLRSIQAKEVPLKIQYRYRPQEYGDQLVRLYLMTNDKTSTLGTTPLPDGTVRMFRDNGRDGLSYLTSQSIKYIPIGDKIELNLGPDPDVIFELIKLKVSRDNIWMQVDGVNVHQRVDDGSTKISADSSVAGWNEHEIFVQRIRNYSANEIDVEIRRSFDGDIVFASSLNPILHDYRTVQIQTSIDPGKKTDLLYELIDRQGYNQKQSNVTLKIRDIKTQ